MIEEIGILRQCWRCGEWLSLDQFRELEKFCAECRRYPGPKHIGHEHPIRTLRVTEQGRGFLAGERVAVLASG